MINIIRTFCIVLLSFASFQVVQGQEKNTHFRNNVRIELSRFEPSEPYDATSNATFFRQIGFYYSRQVYRNFHLSTGYNQWSTFGAGSFTDEAALLNISTWFNKDVPIGTIESRKNYKNFDLAVLYNISTKNKRHNIATGLGMCYTIGINDTISYVMHVQSHDHEVQSQPEDVSYTGVIPQVFYNYVFLKNRVSTGAHIKYRKYINTDLTMLELGIQVGFNF